MIILRTSALLVIAAACASSQWLNHRDARTPRAKDGTPNLSAPAPRLNGKPDLSGVWQSQRSPLSEFAKVVPDEIVKLQVDLTFASILYLNLFGGAKAEDEPLTPEAVAIFQQRASSVGADPPTHCLPIGMPGVLLVYAFKILQTPQEIAILPEHADPPRQIYLDGRSLPRNPDPSWNGYSVGNWQGDTLVVDTIGLNDKVWLDGPGHPRSEQMHMTERYRRRDFGHTDLEITFEDPKYYTRPFNFKTVLNLIPDSDVIEYVCAENERDGDHLKN